jgi:hypothetical protein
MVGLWPLGSDDAQRPASRPDDPPWGPCRLAPPIGPPQTPRGPACQFVLVPVAWH